MKGNDDAAAAAAEILILIEKQLIKNKENPEVVIVLNELKQKVREIKNMANIGFYRFKSNR